MDKAVERKKKGRPSLLDLQKRSLKDQHQLHHQKGKLNPKFPTNPISPTPTRRNPVSDEDDQEFNGKPREKNLKFVLKLPSQRLSLNSASLSAEDDVVTTSNKKGKINGSGDRSGQSGTEKAEKHVSASHAIGIPQATRSDVGTSTPLPDMKLLLFILDRLQKKDTYGVFSEPVDPNELPDYHEVIEHPMDFGTLRKNLTRGAYAKLEEFEKDVFLICSNAMRYNAPDTIYFRQARSIQEIAKKNFGNLRQDSNDNEQECKIARRGRPPTKNLNKEKIRHSLDHPGTELSVATLATGAENTNCSNYDLRKGAISDKSRLADLSGHSFHGSRNSETCSVRSAEHKFERNNEFKGFVSKGNLMKHGKKQVVVDENRRNSYKQAHLTIGDRESSVLTTFHGVSKQLLTVGLHAEHAYGRSLACFAANVGPFTWKVASKKISKSLPLGINFGPGWIGVNEAAVQSSLSFPVPLVQLWPSQSFSLSGNPSAASTPTTAEMKCGMPSTPTVVDSHTKKSPFASPPPLSSSTIINRSSELITESAEVGVLNSDMAIDRSDPPFEIGPNSVSECVTNGFNTASGYNLPAQMGKYCGSVGSPGISLQSSGVGDTMSGSNSNFSP